MIPLRAVGEALGASFEWIATTRTAVMTVDGKNFYLNIDQPLTSDAGRAIVRNNRIFVPLAFISDVLYLEVYWDNE